MQVQQIIQASAQVLTITHLSPGDCYKRVVDEYSGGPVLRLGVVQSVMNNGEDAAVVAVEYTPDPYSRGVKAETRVFTGSKPAAIFPAEPSEVAHHLTEMVEAAGRAVEKAERDLDTARDAYAHVREVKARVQAGQLTAPATGTPALVDGEGD